MKSKMLGALALFTLIGALFVMQSAEQHTPTVEAATGSIAAMNVGTCLTTDGTVFDDDCHLVQSGANGWEIRDKNVEVSTLYATYAHDPKTASDDPRAILTNSDLLKISIADSGRDKRSPILVGTGPSGITINSSGDAGDDPGEPTADAAGALLTIQNLLAGNSKISIVDDDNKTEVTLKADMLLDGTTPPDYVLANSGNTTLNFTGTAAADDPMDVKGNIRFFGCTVADGTTDCSIDGNDSGVDKTELQDITSSIEVDEDNSSGANSASNIAPWLAVNASVPTGEDIIIYAIYYETSKVESLVGGQAYSHGCANASQSLDDGYSLKRTTNTDMTRTNNAITTPWKCEKVETNGSVRRVSDGPTNVRDAETDVVYIPDEINNNNALLVQVKSDGDDTSQNLNLMETGRFTGRYEGFVRLTDPNGARKDSETRNNWGWETDDASGADEDGAAVIGVESGPVTIEYRDTDGKRQTLRIEIDNSPPAITVSNPANGASSGDQSPDFAGTIEDADSGLVDKSFRLVVDNVAGREAYVLGGEALNADSVAGTDSTPATPNDNDGLGKVTHIGEYSGYDADPFGIIAASDLYDLGDDSCDDNDHCFIESEEYDDGAGRGTFDDNVRLDLQDTIGDSSNDVDTRDKEFTIDFQAFVMDMAGNIGFSDADAANPRFINALGEDKASDRGPDGEKGEKHNVLGFYSAHVIKLDEKDPVINEALTSTGFYGRANDKNIADRYGVMVAFDGPIAASSVSNNTFSVTLDDGSTASVVDHDVDGKYVFLKLGSELASDATPMIDIMQGEKVEDMAGNETFGREQDEFEANDGISPRLTVTLSGGSGSGTGDEGPAKLTNDRITVHVSSDEMLSSAPRIIVVCNTLRWNEGGDKDTLGRVFENEIGSRHDVDDFVANRNGSFDSKPTEDNIVTTKPRSSNSDAQGETYDYTCGYDSSPDDNFLDDFSLQGLEVSSHSRPGENWDYVWQNRSSGPGKLNDGVLKAVAFGRDRSKYGPDDSLENWGSASAEFTLDTELKSPIDSGDLQPAPDGKSKEARPFVLIEFDDSHSVTLESVEVDDVEVADQFEQPDNNRFLYWPLSLSQGDHEVEAVATDAAGNEVSFSYDFEVVARGDFVMALNAGWNAISVPADPIDTAIGSVFTDSAITTVIGWDTQGWRIAMRRDGVWESNEKYGALNEIRAKYGYWVKSDGFVRQPVELKGGTSRDAGGTPILISIPTEPGWNFVGVVDQDGDQTEDHFGNSLKGSDNAFIDAGEYLGSTYVRAYTWDATFSRFDVVRPDDTMTIGDGVWVYYPEGTGIAP